MNEEFPIQKSCGETYIHWFEYKHLHHLSQTSDIPSCSLKQTLHAIILQKKKKKKRYNTHIENSTNPNSQSKYNWIIIFIVFACFDYARKYSSVGRWWLLILWNIFNARNGHLSGITRAEQALYKSEKKKNTFIYAELTIVLTSNKVRVSVACANGDCGLSSAFCVFKIKEKTNAAGMVR